MFVNCPHCRALIATDPATDQPPTHCPECRSPLRGQATADPVRDDAPQAGLQADQHGTPRDSWWDEAATRPQPAAPEAEGITAGEGEAGTRDTDAPPPDTGSGTDTAGMDTTDTDAGAPALPSDTLPEASSDAAPSDTTRAALAQARVAPLRGSAPGFLRRRTSAPVRGDWRMPAAVVGLSLLLGLQLLLADRARLSAQAGWRPLLSTLCAGLGCSLPPWREPAAFALLQRDVRQHPTVPGALRVSATFRNDARWPQPWPQLQLTLAGPDGRAAGMRSFTVEEYLGGPPSQAELASGETATVAMDILEPAPDIVSFDFGFR